MRDTFGTEGEVKWYRWCEFDASTAAPVVEMPVPPVSAPSSTAAPPSTSVSRPSANASSDTAAPAPPDPLSPPQWLTDAMKATQEKWRDDKFELILRKVNSASAPEWRIKCLECPGKLYVPGPGETIGNYEVHLRNRLHRQRVNDRVGNSTATTTNT
ncbi:hypothetical protein R3P38DRAFT_3284692 [Favolaschia claudopus]|uniref:Uncharacterized protein n=1 Tax=Favolaschia claudopus TaxID=2862362 RepID=A0AAW0A5V3_9AGAR